MMNNEIMVSICCTAFNHEKYIGKALESFIAQVTDFRYEIIIHDDASTDKTAEIVKSFENKYPDIVYAIYQKENQYSKGKKITQEFIAPKTRGKYVAICEGDDYWSDPYKLQKQVEALEQHKDCFFCVHRVEEIKENGEKTGVLFPRDDISTGIINARDFLLMTRFYSFHTSSYMFDGAKWREYLMNPPDFKNICPVGDETYLLYFAQLGPIFYLKDKMSCYRRGVASSWSKNQNSGDIFKKKCNHVKLMAETLRLYDEYTHYLYHDICVLRRAYYLKTAWLLEGTTKEIFRSESKEIFEAFPIKHKIALTIAAIFPRWTQAIYKNKMAYTNKKNGY